MHVYTCPKGHQSQAGDYCDECGAPIGAASVVAASPAVSPATPPAPTLVEPAAGSGEPCPECETPRGGRFCEVCGHDFVLAGYGTPPSPVATTATPAIIAPSVLAPDIPAASGKWRLVVTADEAYHARMQAQADPDAEPIALPAFVPERRFDLDRPRILIGRRSRSRGIEPEIDLSGPPADPAVSHAHALLIAQSDGSWSVVDLDSSNGTYLNDATDSLAPNTASPLSDGDVVYVGAWTAMTLRSA